MSALTVLIDGLSGPEKAAIEVVKLALDCFNTAEGLGLMTGVSRYQMLAGRVEICAVQANSMTAFWALLLRRMQWPVPPKKADSKIVECLSAPDEQSTLRVLATETASIISLARMLHDADKESRKELAMEQLETGSESSEDFNDGLFF